MTPQVLQELARKHGTPLYVYDGIYLRKRAVWLQDLCQPSGCLLRYAVKANPHPKIIKLYDKLGLHFDASSEYEAEHLTDLGIEPRKISLSSQQPPRNMRKALDSNIKFVATSLHQLDLVAQSGWRRELAVRLNPGLGSGHSRRTTTGGVSSSFGIWHEYLPLVLAWQKESGCVIDRVQTHIGSGADPKIWRKIIVQALKLVKELPSVTALNLGGGYSVARMPNEKETDMAAVLKGFKEELDTFQRRTGRNIDLEIEPGTWLVANSGYLLSRIIDIVDTGKKGFSFLKLDTGMNDLLRPTLYGAQHPIDVLTSAKTYRDYVIVGHNCESGDLLTPEPGNSENIMPRRLKEARIGDLVIIGGAGAYAASMRAIGYNSFPSAAEIFINE